MTVITKNLSDKKADNLQEPLVDNIVIEPSDEAKKTDVEAGRHPRPSKRSSPRYFISGRVKPYYSLMFILMIVLLVTTTLLGIFGTEYLYEQYRYLVGNDQNPDVYRAWGTFSFNEDPTAMAYENKLPARFEKTQENMDTESILSEVKQPINALKRVKEKFEKKENELLQHFGSNQNEATIQEVKDDIADDRKNELKEEFEVDVSNERYEKINVPSGGASRFIHDFYSNYTAIVDEKNLRCFVMPLDRSVILPPKTLYDLLSKMQNGYYSIDTERVRREMQVVTPAIADLESYGVYIARECQGFTSYKLEKLISGVTKRSVSDYSSYQFFDGNRLVEFYIKGVPSSIEVVPKAMV